MTSRVEHFSAQPFSLCLGAGFFGFFAHTGVLLELEARGLAPARVHGVSAGALAGGLWAMGLEAAELEARLDALRREAFWDPGLPLGGLLKGRAFGALIRDATAATGRTRVEESKVPLSVAAWDLAQRRALALIEGPADRAIRASCCVPFMFRPVRMGSRLFLDGGLGDRDGEHTCPGHEPTLVCAIPSRSRRPVFKTPPPPTGRAAGRFVLDDLPPVSPFALERGPLALRQARERFARWLDEPMPTPRAQAS